MFVASGLTASTPTAHHGSGGPTVSVIIPLEFHRGQAESCIELWLAGQSHPREDFELILVCPPDFPHDQRRVIQEKMASWDRLVEFPLHHDIALVEQGAKLARGNYFFFTESHVLPEPETLAQVMQAFRDHPEWAGFSLKSVPIIHNFLSGVEAEFYAMAIDPSESKPAWCQVLDQCFAVRREPYFEAQGFQAEFGHYSEWVLAARLYVAGHVIGYFPEARIHHYYIGEIHHLEEFTIDFARGHWRWFERTSREPAHSLMQEPLVFAQRHDGQRLLARALAKVACRSRSTVAVRSYWKLAEWLGPHGPLWLSRWKYRTAKARLFWSCQRKKPSALAALIDLNDAIVTMTHQKELLKMPAPGTVRLPDAGEWTPLAGPPLTILGLYAREEFRGRAFCWSQPAAMVQLDLAPGRYRLELEWLDIRRDLVEPRLYLNERQVARSKRRHFKFRVRCSWHQKSGEPLRFAWTCEPFVTTRDTRLLTLPVVRISWKLQTPAPVPTLSAMSGAARGAGR